MAITGGESWVPEIADAVAANDPIRIAHRMGGLIANDERIRQAIEASLKEGGNERAVLIAIAKTLTT